MRFLMGRYPPLTVTRAPGHLHSRTCAAATGAPPQHPRPPQPPHLEGWGKSGAEAPDPARDAFKLTGTSRRRGGQARRRQSRETRGPSLRLSCEAVATTTGSGSVQAAVESDRRRSGCAGAAQSVGAVVRGPAARGPARPCPGRQTARAQLAHMARESLGSAGL